VEVGAVDLGVSARPDGPDRLTLGNGRSGADLDRAEMGERHRKPVVGGDRERATGARDGAAEGDGPRGRRENLLLGGRGDVDPAVLARGVRVRWVEAEGLEHGAADRPRPGTRHRRDEQRGQNRDEQHTTHRHHLCCQEREQSIQTRSDVVVLSSEITKLSQSASVEVVARHAAEA
jgi:hypothetical protein